MVARFPLFHRALQAALLLLVVAFGAMGCADGSTHPPTPVPQCGDGMVQEGEECDDGVDNSDGVADACRTTCRNAQCGDTVVDSKEECDDGNTEEGDGCSDTCQQEFVCGDNVCDVERGESCGLCETDCCVCGDQECTSSFGETCDMCPSECCPSCGNGVLDPGEDCDDGGNVATDGCSPGCLDEDGEATCGNGVLEAGESCDDNNLTEFDGCSPTCTVEFTCGDGVCDAMTGETCQACVQDCCPDCGNGVIDGGEQCDGSNVPGLTCTEACYDGGTLGCTAWCTYDFTTCSGDLPTCGDGIAECTEECDTGDLRGATCNALGFSPGTLGCTSCAYDASQCGARFAYLRENFDEACPPVGWTLGGDWQCGTPTSVGPRAARSTPACLATQIAGEYNNYQEYATTTATTPPIDLTAATQPVLSYFAWVETEGETYDGYNVKISTDGGATFSLLTEATPPYDLTVGGEPAWGGDQTELGWHPILVDLQAYVGSVVLLQFSFRSDRSLTYAGVYIDDFQVLEHQAVPLEITTSATLPDTPIGDLYVQPLARNGGSTTAIWSVVSGVNSTWLSIDPVTGQLSGTPTEADLGPVSVTVRIEEPGFPSNFSERSFSFDVFDFCGNGVIDRDEQCDGAALGGASCTSTCYDGGALGCTPECTFDFSACTGELPTCGDGVAECTEACDGDDLRGATCISLGYTDGPLSCASCGLDVSSCGRQVSFFQENFDVTCPPAGWTLGGDWECGTPTGVGPASASSAPACLATQIGRNYHNDQSYATATATTPPIDLITATDAVLHYNAWVDTEGESFDGYYLKISTDGGATFSLLTDVTPAYDLIVDGEHAWGGNHAALGWQPVVANLQAYLGNTVILRFAFRSDFSETHPGVYIDDLQVAEPAAFPLSITTAAALSGATLDVPYAQALARTGGSAAATWSITGGTNHTWLSVDPVTGQLSGTPGASDVGPVSVLVRIEEPTLPTNFSERTFTFDVSYPCGNGAIDPGEECDGTALAGRTCADSCYDGGALACSATCTYDFSACIGTLPTCGDGVAGCHEACDGDDLRGMTCTTLGLADGALSCASCALDTSGCGPRVVYMTQSFDTGCPPTGWTLGGDWECGTPSGVGPAAAHSTPACIATQIDANYRNNQSYATATATTPPIDLTSATDPVLSYYAWVKTEGSTYDGYNVKVSVDGGATYSLLTDVTPAYNLVVGGQAAWGDDSSSRDWQRVLVNLQAYVGRTVILRFAFRSDSSDVFPGVYIDDLQVAERAFIPLLITTSSTLANAAANAPYAQPLIRTGATSAATWSILGGTNHAWLTLDAATGQLSGTPDASNLGPVSFTARIEEPATTSNFREQTFSFNVVDAVHLTSFEGACPAGWTLTGDWECGVPSTVGPYAFSGNQCIATQIDTNYSNSRAYATTTATSPIIDLTTAAAPQLSFRLWFNTEASRDAANLKISTDGGPFTVFTDITPAYTGVVDTQSAWSGNQTSAGWQLATANLSVFAGHAIQLQFSFRSDSSTVNPGFYIDDVTVTP